MYLSNSDASNFHEVLGSLNSTEYLSSSAYKNKEKKRERERGRERGGGRVTYVTDCSLHVLPL